MEGKKTFFFFFFFFFFLRGKKNVFFFFFFFFFFSRNSILSEVGSVRIPPDIKIYTIGQNIAENGNNTTFARLGGVSDGYRRAQPRTNGHSVGSGPKQTAEV